MKPVDQTLFGDQVGNCFAACVASLLEVPLESLPNFCVEYPDPWFEKFEAWLAERGLIALCFSFQDQPQNAKNFLKWAELVKSPFIAGGDTPRGKHVVLWENGKLLHDPNPNHGRTGIEKIDDVIFIFAEPTARKNALREARLLCNQEEDLAHEVEIPLRAYGASLCKSAIERLERGPT